MSNGKVHRQVGGVAGGAAAWVAACNEAPLPRVIETLGGIMGGAFVGARLPDIFDPPTSPRHRSIGHGMIPVAVVGGVAVKKLPGAQEYLRTQAEAQRQRRLAATSPLAKLWHGFLELLCRLGSGALAGILGGYASHILMDATTPAGLPLLA